MAKRLEHDEADIHAYVILIRQPYIVSADLYFTRDSFFLSSSFSFFRPLISELAERNSTKLGHMVGSKCSLKTHFQNLGYPLPLQIGGFKTTLFEDFAT